MSEAYLCVVEGPEGTFLRVAKPNEPPQDFRLTAERRLSIISDLAASLQHDAQRHRDRELARVREWMERDAAAS